MRLTLSILVGVVLAGLFACVPPEPVPSHKDVASIIRDDCVRCHVPNGPSPAASASNFRIEAGLNATDEEIISAIRNEPSSGGISLIDPGDPDSSLIYVWIADGSMPQGGPRLSDEKVKIVREWIAHGALSER